MTTPTWQQKLIKHFRCAYFVRLLQHCTIFCVGTKYMNEFPVALMPSADSCTERSRLLQLLHLMPSIMRMGYDITSGINSPSGNHQICHFTTALAGADFVFYWFSWQNTQDMPGTEFTRCLCSQPYQIPR